MEKLRIAIDTFYANRCKHTFDEIVNCFREMVRNNEKVLVPYQDVNGKLYGATIDYRAKPYLVAFSNINEAIKEEGITIIETPIISVLNSLYNDPHIRGLAIDPFSKGALHIATKDLQHFSGIECPRLKRVDWGKGIPCYKPSDLMTEEEILDFGIETVFNYLMQTRAEILEINDALNQPTNIAARINGRLSYIKIKSAVIGASSTLENITDMPELTTEETEAALKFGKAMNADVYYAPVTFCSVDPERMKSGIALYGDGYYPNFAGISKLS